MKIYKFCSLNEFARDIIVTGEFFFSDWKTMNDPMEGVFQYYKDEHTEEEVTTLYSDKNKYGVSCFAKNYHEILMWSHYADNHNGICIEVEIDKKLLEKNKLKIKDIEYQSHIGMLFRKEETTPDAIELLSKKITKWEYEQEVRIFCYGKNSLHKVGKIKSIFIKKGSDRIELIKEYINTKNIAIIEVELNFDRNEVVKV